MRSNYISSWLNGLSLFFTLMVFFTASRFFYILDYWGVLSQSPYTFGEIFYAFFSAARYDCTVSAGLALIVFLIDWGLCFNQQLRKASIAVGLILLNLSIILVVSDHFFYIYFKDHFNIFFFEFWENISNSQLVIAGVGDEINLPKSLFALISSMIVFTYTFLRVRKLFALNKEKLQFKFSPALTIFLTLLALRGTTQVVPLALQFERTAISSNQFINLVNMNTFYPLYKGWQAYAGANRPSQLEILSEEALRAEFKEASVFLPGAEPEFNQGYVTVKHDITPSWQKIFKRKPKNIVLLFMESFAAWPLNHPDREFSLFVSKNIQELRSKGYYFSHYFEASAGTMKNIISANYSLYIPRDMAPSFNYHKEAYKPFESVLPRVVAKLGMKPEFYYAGFAAWHRLYNFIPSLGYEYFFYEGTKPELPHYKYGLFDGTMFSQLNEDLKQAKDPKFVFSMSLSNHPPYTVPKEFDDETWRIPDWAKDKLFEGEKKWYMRFNAYRYADHALGEFIRNASKEDYFSDTLFIITADHSFGGVLMFPDKDAWKTYNIPFLLYAPDLLKDEYVGKVNKTFANHIDIVPTIAAIMTEKPMKLTTSGKNLLADRSYPEWTGSMFSLSCIKRYCLTKNRVYYVNDQYLLEPTDQSRINSIKNAERALYNSALRYIQKY